MYLFLGAALTEYYRPGSLKQQIFISVPEIRNPKSRCQWGHAPPEASGEESFLGSSSFSWWSAVLGNSWSSSCFTSASVPVVTWHLPVCLCLLVATFSSSKYTGILEDGLRGWVGDVPGDLGLPG